MCVCGMYVCVSVCVQCTVYIYIRMCTCVRMHVVCVHMGHVRMNVHMCWHAVLLR